MTPHSAVVLGMGIFIFLILWWNWRMAGLRFADKATIASQADLIDNLQTQRRNARVHPADRELEDAVDMEANMLPVHIEDASMIIAVIDRVPDHNDIFDNDDTPFIWMHPRLQKSWALKHRPGEEARFWEETTPPSTSPQEAMHMIAFTPDEMFVTAMAIFAPGCNDMIGKVTSPNSDVAAQHEGVRGLPLAVCKAMDVARGESDNQWARIKMGVSGPVKLALAAHVKRPINLDDEADA